MGGALRFGGTMELTGIDETIDPVRLRGIVNSVTRYYPDVTPAHFDGCHGALGPATVLAGRPALRRPRRRFANLSVATGHAMMGVSLGPITGKLMAELCPAPPSCNIDALRPDRYS